MILYTHGSRLQIKRYAQLSKLKDWGSWRLDSGGL